MNSNKPTEEQPNNEFQVLIPQVHKGAFLHEASTELRKVIQGAMQSGKPAKLNLSITIIPHGDGAIAMDGKVSVVIAKPKKNPTVMFVTEDFRLVRDNPEQFPLPLGVVEKPVGQIVDVVREQKPIAAAS